MAFAVDLALGCLLAICIEKLLNMIGILDGPNAGFGLAFVVLLCYLLAKDSVFKGRSLGKIVCGLRIERAVDDSRPGFIRMIVRNLTVVHFGLAMAEYLIAAHSRGMRRIGDILAGTKVVATRPLKDKFTVFEFVLCVVIYIVCIKYIPGFIALLGEYLSTLTWPVR